MKKLTLYFDDNKALKETGFDFREDNDGTQLVDILHWLSWAAVEHIHEIEQSYIRRAQDLEKLLACITVGEE